MSTIKGIFAKKRRALMKQLDKQDAVILFGSSELVRNGDVHYPFRQNSTFYYFTGYTEPDAVAILLPGNVDGEYILFNLPNDPVMERWVGARVGQEGAIDGYDADLAFRLDQIDEKVLELLSDRKKIYYDMSSNPLWDQKINEWTRQLQARGRRSALTPSAHVDLKEKSNELRLSKDSEEIELLRTAAQKSAQAHIIAMKNCRPGMNEFELEAIINFELNKQGCRSWAYPAIVGGGRNACILHYVENNDSLKSGDLVLVDAGGEYQYYASDITRTFPVNGKFTPDQASVYNIVLDAQQQIIKLIKPGLSFDKLQETAINVIVTGLLQLGILSGTLEQALKDKTYQEYYMHSVSHWLGLDVHDAGAYQTQGQWRSLKEGMVLTIEPGLYLSAKENLDKRWWNIGVRIEDDVLVTAKGCEVLSSAVPKTIAEIESIMTQST